MTLATIKNDETPLALEIRSSEGATMFAVTNEGRVFWNGREIQSDEDFAKSFANFATFIEGTANGDIHRILSIISDEQRLAVRNSISETGSLIGSE